MENENEVITETRYRCPKCNRVLPVLKEAEECLSRHAYPKEIVGYTYCGYGIPTEITIMLSDGHTATYRL